MGGPLAYCVRRQLGRRWLALAVVAAIGGAVFGGAGAAAAAARRTASAYSRFADEADAVDAYYINYPSDGTAELDPSDISALDGVARVDAVAFDYMPIGAGVAWLGDPTGDLGATYNRSRVLEGRWFEESKANEAVISFALAEREGLGVGDTFQMFDPDVLSAEEQEQAEEFLDQVPEARIHIVGVVASPGQFPPVLSLGSPLIQMSPAFARLEGLESQALLITLADGADTARLRADVLGLARDEGGGAQFVVHDDLAADVNRSLRPQVVALSVLAVVLAVAALLVVAQAVARLVDDDAADDLALRGIGVGRRQLVLTTAVTAAVVGAAAALVGLVTAASLSPLSPTGLARVAEPDRGMRLDGWVLAAVAVLAVVVITGVAVALRLRGLATTTNRRSLVVRSWRAGPIITIGLRRAFDRGGDEGRVPVWSTLIGVTASLAAVVTALTVAASLDRQLDDPEHYGLRWELEILQFTESALVEDGTGVLAADDRVRALAVGNASSVNLDGRPVTVIGMDPVRGELRPPLVRGTYPDAPDAVAMGQRTLDHFAVDVGDTVDLAFDEIGGEPIALRVVGEVILPTPGSGARLDEGVLLSLEGLARLAGETAPGASEDDEDDEDDEGEGEGEGEDGDGDLPVALFVAGTPGADLDAVISDLVDEVDPGEPPSLLQPNTPADIVDLARARSMPTVFAVVMALVSIAALAHTLLVSAKRRQRDSAVLRSLGVRVSELRRAGAVQALALATVAVLVGVPAGVALGRAAWGVLAGSIGSPLDARVPVSVVLFVPLLSLALAAALSLASKHGAASHPATALRAE